MLRTLEDHHDGNTTVVMITQLDQVFVINGCTMFEYHDEAERERIYEMHDVSQCHADSLEEMVDYMEKHDIGFKSPIDMAEGFINYVFESLWLDNGEDRSRDTLFYHDYVGSHLMFITEHFDMKDRLGDENEMVKMFREIAEHDLYNDQFVHCYTMFETPTASEIASVYYDDEELLSLFGDRMNGDIAYELVDIDSGLFYHIPEQTEELCLHTMETDINIIHGVQTLTEKILEKWLGEINHCISGRYQDFYLDLTPELAEHFLKTYVENSPLSHFNAESLMGYFDLIDDYDVISDLVCKSLEHSMFEGVYFKKIEFRFLVDKLNKDVVDKMYSNCI